MSTSADQDTTTSDLVEYEPGPKFDSIESSYDNQPDEQTEPVVTKKELWAYCAFSISPKYLLLKQFHRYVLQWR